MCSSCKLPCIVGGDTVVVGVVTLKGRGLGDVWSVVTLKGKGTRRDVSLWKAGGPGDV